MDNFDEIQEVLKELKQNGASFAEFVATAYKDKFVEIYLGDSYEDVSTEQISTSYPAVFCGKVVGAYRECLILKAIHVNKEKHAHFGNLLFINERAIRSLCEINGNCCLQDMILRSIDVNPIYNAHVNKQKIKVKK